nr:NADH-quinone oxidoreductase subunit A [Mobiluncus mulieris]
MLAAALFVAIAGMSVGAIMGPSRPDKVKNANYECGCDPTPNRGNQARFPVKYYLTAMMFIIFDIEVVFLYPWAVSFMEQGKFGMLAMMLFVELLAVPFIYVWARRGFDWN